MLDVVDERCRPCATLPGPKRYSSYASVAATLDLDGETVGSGRVERTHAMLVNLDQTNVIGCDRRAR